MRGASPREICLTSRSQASSSTRAGREQAPGERPGREGPACSKDDTATDARVRAAAESGGWGGWGAGVEKPSWLPEKTLCLIEGLSVSPTISGKTHPFTTLSHFLLCLPTHCALTVKILTSGGQPPALWPSPLPVSRALSVRSPRALMSRKGLFPMPMETICCTRSSREQRPCYQPFAPSVLQP